MSAAFLLTTLIVVVTPGIGVLYTLSAGLTEGRQASVVAAFACTLGIVPHMAAAIVGLAAILNASAVAFQTLKFAGVAYLLWMAIGTLRETGSLRLDAPPPRSSRRIITSGVLVNVLNPKLSIFFLAFLPQFVKADQDQRLLHMLALSGIFMLATFVVFALYGLFAAAVRAHVISRPRVLTWMRRTFAGAFVALGAKLALTQR
ncbi:MAG TPA: LysE family translocator [Burkholderiaceae bacterium]|nr:LysE family translocator [Burkholderiaceae bacterium]